MSIEFIDCEQRSPQWYSARLGLPTASEFATILAKGRDGGQSIGRRKYMLTLAGELMTGEPSENYTNAHIERGRVMEEEARTFYSFLTDAEPTRVGFIRNGSKGCSPDALLDKNGVLEIKTAAPHILGEIILKDEFPPEHKAQCQGALWVAEREWLDLMIYWPKMPPFLKRVYRDEMYIAALAKAVDLFNAELAAAVGTLRRYGQKVAA